MPTAFITRTSSGLGSALAEVLSPQGWSGYALTKAALNMLAKLYAHGFAQTRIAALAPLAPLAPRIIDIREILDAEAYARLYLSTARSQS